MGKYLISESDFKRLSTLIAGGKHAEAANLGKQITSAKIVKDEQLESYTVRLNSKVEVHDLANKRTIRLKIVLPDEIDLSIKHISVFAPICVALFGRRKGDTVSWTTTEGEKKFIIHDVNNN